jgi:quercetin dioxygenase-like cupin family protein
MKRSLVIAAVCAAAVLATTAVALATPGGGFVATLFSRAGLTQRTAVTANGITLDTGAPADFASQTITYSPGGFSGWHRHPGFVLVEVQSGSVDRYVADCTVRTYTAGQAFVEHGSEPSMQIRNGGTTDAVLYVTYIVPRDAPLRIDDPAPACASFTPVPTTAPDRARDRDR